MRKTPLLLLSFISFLLFFSNFAFGQEKDLEAYRPLLVKNAVRLGITPTDAADAVITQAYTDKATRITYIYLQQSYQQIQVYNTIITAAFIDGSLQYASGTFVKNISTKAGNPVRSKSYMDAVRGAARHLHLNANAPLSSAKDLFAAEKKYTVVADAIARRPIETTLCWTPSDDKQQVTLTWNVNIQVKDSADWWNVRMNAQTGEFVQKDNWTVSEQMPDPSLKKTSDLPAEDKGPAAAVIHNKTTSSTGNAGQGLLLAPPNVTSATYQVIPYPFESPIHTPFANEVNPWLKAGATNNAITLGWHFDNVANYDITRGNNVFAFLDRRANNTPDAVRNWPDTSLTPAPDLSFIHNINPAQQPWLNTESKKAALDNLFYWNNLMHDVTYQYGFTEVAGNFQRDNLGRGGLGNDPVIAHAQDSAGYNNAFFSTPADGGTGLMRMYNWSTRPGFNISSPQAIAGNYASLESSFASPNKLVDRGPITGNIVWYNDDAAGTIHRGCLPATNAAAVAGNIALIDAFGGTNCTTYAFKVKNAQNAGAIAVIIYFPTNTLGGIGGTDATITIPTIVVTNTTGLAIAAQLNASQVVTATISSGIYIDASLDNGIIAHEYGHGVSVRLTGGPQTASCLNNAEQGGEGWSDYMALMMTTNWATAQLSDGPNPRPMATYAAGQMTNGPGIRRFPYSTNLSVNPLTYANMAANPEVHATGEIWCSALWDMTWNIIQQQNAITPDFYNSSATGGNIIAMNLVITGMKLQPCSPGFLDARNAILVADSILYGNIHKCAIWNAFARRGMGYSAIQGSSFSATDQTAAFDLPSGVKLNNQLPVVVDVNADYTFTRTATCNCQPATLTLRDTIPAGFTYVSSTPAGTLTGNILTFPATAFATTESKSFSITLKAPATGCRIDTVLNDNRETSTTGGFTSSGTSAWTPSTAKAHSGNTSWFAPDIDIVSTASLTSTGTAITTAKPFSILSFWHNFNTENLFDGGVVEYSTNGGVSWTDASPLFVSNGYNKTMDASTTLTGRKAFSGNSQGFGQTTLNLSSFGTTPVQFRFRMETDLGTGIDGWYIDDIIQANGCGEIMRSGIYDGTGVRLDSASVPVFVSIETPLPLTLLWFYANQVGGQVALDWKTESEIDVKNFTIEWSADAVNWNNLGNVNAQNRSNNSYNFIHSNPVAGKNFYRLKMIDIDGKFTYSPVRIISLQEKGNPAVVLIPNPVNGDAVLYISKEVKATSVNVYDASGSLVKQMSVGAGMQQVKISTDGLAPGVYTIETKGANRQITRMLVQH